MMSVRHTLAGIALAATVPAQILYFDADHTKNTTLSNGAAFAPNIPGPNGSDGNWDMRPFANGGTIYSSNDVNAAGQENAPMLRTTLTNLTPGSEYLVYGYFWGTAGTIWRGRALVANSEPAPEIPGYNTRHFSTSVFSAMRPLAFDAPLGTASPASLGLQYDAMGMETSGRFFTPVMIQEGNRWLYEAPLGVFAADTNGEIKIYIDDLADTDPSNRTWYDGIGLEPAPLRYGSGCGATTAPIIGFQGSPSYGTNFLLTLDSTAANSPCVLIIGGSKTTWNGIPLPFNLSGLGLPGCFLNASYDGAANLTTDGSGDAVISFPLPAAGPVTTVYWQWLVLNAPSAELSQGIETTLHR